jgi:hypothetical protein
MRGVDRPSLGGFEDGAVVKHKNNNKVVSAGVTVGVGVVAVVVAVVVVVVVIFPLSCLGLGTIYRCVVIDSGGARMRYEQPKRMVLRN